MKVVPYRTGYERAARPAAKKTLQSIAGYGSSVYASMMEAYTPPYASNTV